MPELMADGKPATLRRHSVPDENDAAASFAVGQQAAFEALCRKRLDLDDVELPQSSSIGYRDGQIRFQP